jgi:hypothetical protein
MQNSEGRGCWFDPSRARQFWPLFDAMFPYRLTLDTSRTPAWQSIVLTRHKEQKSKSFCEQGLLWIVCQAQIVQAPSFECLNC